MWMDSVTSQPDGYQMDENGNVTISSARGMAWLISVVGGFNGQIPNNLDGKTINLTENIDLSACIWTAIGSDTTRFMGALMEIITLNTA